MNRLIDFFRAHVLLIYFLVCSPGVMLANDEDSEGTIPSVSAPIESVVLYRNHARVVRVMDSENLASMTVRVVGLPSKLRRDSLRVVATENESVPLVRLVPSTEPSGPAADPSWKQLQDRLSEQRAQVLEAEGRQRVIEQNLATLDQLVSFSASKTQQELGQGTLNVQTVTSLADYAMKRRGELMQQLQGTLKTLRELREAIPQTQIQIARAESRSGDPTHDAIVTLRRPSAGPLRLSYEVDGVRWKPTYVIEQSSEDESGASVKLYGDVVQTSGEDWKDVSLSVTTANIRSDPTMPMLTPLRVRAVEPGKQQARTNLDSMGMFPSAGWVDASQAHRAAIDNLTAARRQVSEITEARQIQRSIADDAAQPPTDETFRIDMPVSLESSHQEQRIKLFQAMVPSELFHRVTPLLTSYAYRQAKLTNGTGKHWSAGDVEVHWNGELVGKTRLPPTAAGQPVSIGFGVDRQVRSRRELMDREESVTGGNETTSLTYRLVINNFHDRPVPVRLYDRLPLAPDDQSVRIDLSDQQREQLSDDPLYQRMEQPLGILRWDLTVPADRHGADAFDHEYQYSVEHQRGHTVRPTLDGSAAQDDLFFQQTHGFGGGMGGGLGGGMM